MSQTLSVGLLGCGQATQKYHIPAINAIDDIELAWVCDTDESQAQTAGNDEDVDWYSELESAISVTPDVIHVNTPPFTHKDLALASLDAGANVLLEKPAAMTVDEVDELIAADDASSKKICMVHNNLYFDPMLEVLRSINAGEFGEILGVRSFLGGSPSKDKRDWSQQSHGGAIRDRLPHPIYLVTHFMDRISNRSVRVQRRDDVVDGVSIQIDDGERFGYVEARQTAIPAKSVEVIGSQKRVAVDLFNYTSVGYDTIDRSPISMMTENVGSAYQVLRGTGINGFDFVRDKLSKGSKFSAPGHYHLIKRFQSSILSNESPPISLSEGKKVVELLNEIEST